MIQAFFFKLIYNEPNVAGCCGSTAPVYSTNQPLSNKDSDSLQVGSSQWAIEDDCGDSKGMKPKDGAVRDILLCVNSSFFRFK